MNATKQQVDRPAMAIAVGLLAIALIVLWDASALPAPVYGIGPRAMPIIVAIGLIVLALGNAWLAWCGDFPEREPYDARALGLILGGLVALIAVIGLGGGFIIATTVVFAATAAAFGFVMSLTVYLLFTKLLTLSLPIGPLERLF
jgi:putative tricarboxylic transport membrane protein